MMVKLLALHLLLNKQHYIPVYTKDVKFLHKEYQLVNRETAVEE